MPEVLTNIQVYRLTPAPAILFQSMLSLCYLSSSNVGLLINYVGFATWLSIGAAVVVIPYLRWKQPDRHRPIKVNLFWPIIYILLTLALLVIATVEAPWETLWGSLLILSGIPVYFIFVSWKSKPAFVLRAISE